MPQNYDVRELDFNSPDGFGRRVDLDMYESEEGSEDDDR